MYHHSKPKHPESDVQSRDKNLPSIEQKMEYALARNIELQDKKWTERMNEQHDEWERRVQIMQEDNEKETRALVSTFKAMMTEQSDQHKKQIKDLREESARQEQVYRKQIKKLGEDRAKQKETFKTHLKKLNTEHDRQIKWWKQDNERQKKAVGRLSEQILDVKFEDDREIAWLRGDRKKLIKENIALKKELDQRRKKYQKQKCADHAGM